MNNIAPKVVIIDSNAWNFLYENNIDLNSEGLKGFTFAVTWMIDTEMEFISNKPEKKGLFDYYRKYKPSANTLNKRFGFYCDNPPGGIQRYAGFGNGQFIPEEESDFLAHKSHQIGPLKKTLLFKNETDLDIASRAYGGMFVLTRDFNKKGPLQDIENVVRVPDFSVNEADFIQLLTKQTNE